MISAKTWVILTAASAAVAYAAWFSVDERSGNTPVEPVGSGAVVFPDLSKRVNEVASLAISGVGQTATLTRTADGQWTLKEKAGYPVKADPVRAVVLGLAELKLVEPRTDNPELYDRLGVGDPAKSTALVVSARDGAGQPLAELVVGKTKSYATSTLPAELYVRRPGEARAWLAAGRLEPRADPLSWLDRTLPGLAGEKVREVTVTQPDGAAVRLTRAEPGKPDLTVEALPAGKKILSQVLVNDLGNAVAHLFAEDVRKADSLDFGAAVTAVFRTFDGLAVTAKVIAVEGKDWVTLEATPGPEAESQGDDKARAALAGQIAAINGTTLGWAYHVAGYQAKTLRTKLEDLLAREGEPAAGGR